MVERRRGSHGPPEIARKLRGQQSWVDPHQAGDNGPENFFGERDR